MARLEYYEGLGIYDEDAAFDHFVDSLDTYYDADYYVNWDKVFTQANEFETELALLSTLCGKRNSREEARELLTKYPQIIPSLSILIACRGSITLVNPTFSDQSEGYSFKHEDTPSKGQAELYAKYLDESGLLELLERIKNVKDYVIGVEVGMDTNGRKNRSGDCAIRAIRPWVEEAVASIPGAVAEEEVRGARLIDLGCPLPESMTKLQWDFAVWSGPPENRFVLLEVNHYGAASGGSKPSEIARSYTARQTTLSAAGIGFVWITDGNGWHKMKNPLRTAFTEIDWIVNVKLAAGGMLQFALENMLSS